MERIIKTAKEFISIKSIPENKKELNKILDLAIFKLKGFTIEKFEREGVRSILVYNEKERPKKFKLILNGHLDVIPGKDEQYKPIIKGDRLYGVGSMDMKANMACLIAVFKDMAKKLDYPLGLQIVTDEEIGGFNGTKYQVEKGVRADFVIAGEPTNFDIVNKAKGILQLQIFAKGKTAHGAYPWRGDNAVWKLINFLNVLKNKFPNPDKEKWATTLNLSNIKTNNESFNKIPDICVASLDIRYIPEDKNNILKKIKDILPEGFKLKIVANEAPLITDKNNKYIKKIEEIGKQILKKNISLRNAQGSSDARHYTRIKCQGVEFGPIGGNIGADNEWVDIPSLKNYYKILKELLLLI